ncbi:MAG: lipoprotein-releasing system ATP-binding protein LolD [Flavobacteriaceae bacterium]|nr:lipoprotein-releasing system ATP-binding protein LolD [Flavobacteriaceae bacterium]|tara:strand:- start:356 stop:1015 length:660 start_codon:yes stop_codon:yes gene_type:complete
MIKATNISKSFGKKKVIDNIDLNVEKGEIISIVGPSGAGKTTLMNIIGTLEKPDSKNYSLLINKIETSKLLENEISKFRNNELGFVFQFHELLPEFTAQENICIPAMIKRVKKKEYLEKSEMLINILNIAKVKDQRPNELSGGEQQRVAIARALINDPKVLLADEPSGNLDSDNAKKLYELFFELREKMDLTIITITHNKELSEMSDRKLRLIDGKWSK